MSQSITKKLALLALIGSFSSIVINGSELEIVATEIEIVETIETAETLEAAPEAIETTEALATALEVTEKSSFTESMKLKALQLYTALRAKYSTLTNKEKTAYGAAFVATIATVALLIRASLKSKIVTPVITTIEPWAKTKAAVNQVKTTLDQAKNSIASSALGTWISTKTTSFMNAAKSNLTEQDVKDYCFPG